MAQNRRSEHEPAHSSSSEEEEDGSSDEQEASESEEELAKTSPPTPPATKKPSSSKKPATNQTPLKPQSSCSDDSQAESESDSDSPPENTPKPVEDLSKPTKIPRSGAGAKRPADSEAKDSKRAKKIPAEDDQKKQLFQRLWSEEDEIAILKGIMEYTSKKGADPMSDMHAFYDFIKKSIHCDVTKNQLAAKVRRLKKKYENNASKEKGKDRTFSKQHEQKAYDLSKKIWGKKGNTIGEVDGSTKVNNGSEKKNQNQNQRASSIKVNGPENKNQKPKVERVSMADVKKDEPVVEIEPNGAPSRAIEFGGSISDVKFQEEIMRNGVELIKGDKKKELDEKWKKQRVLEAEVYLKRLDLIREQMNLVLEALKSDGN
ncbi:hypothetical protein LguiB_034161 [Lonicera macranthoides]